MTVMNGYQSIIRGGHSFLTIGTGPERVTNMGDRLDLLIPLNQDAMDRHACGVARSSHSQFCSKRIFATSGLVRVVGSR